MEKLFSLLNKIPPDKALHALSGGAVFALLYLFFSLTGFLFVHFAVLRLNLVHVLILSALFSISTVLLIGIAKEIYDGKHPDIHTKDWWDALATTSGAVIGLLCALPILFIA